VTRVELRTRMARSGLTGEALAGALGIASPQVAKWRTGARPIPEHHVPEIVRLTDGWPLRTARARRPPASMTPARLKRSRSEDPGSSSREDVPGPVRVDLWSGLADALSAALAPWKQVPEAAAPAAKPMRVPESVPTTKPVAAIAAAGPLHTDFVNQHNAAQQRRPANFLPDGTITRAAQSDQGPAGHGAGHDLPGAKQGRAGQEKPFRN